MKKIFCIPLLLILLFNFHNAVAQDKIVKRNGEIISCKIVEILAESVKYNATDFGDVSFDLPINQVEKLIFANGKEIVIDHAARAGESIEMNSQDLFLVQRKMDLKTEFISSMGGTFSLTFQKAITPEKSWELTAGIVGLGIRNPDDAIGFASKFGYKFKRSPDYYLQKMRYAHILKGSYVRPEIVFGAYSGTEPLYEEDYNRIKFAVLINLGKQIVYSDRFVLDYYAGIGYGYTNDTGFSGSFPYVFAVVSKEVPIALSWGLRIGFMLPDKKPGK